MGYGNQTQWQTIQRFLPPEWRLSPGDEPAEEWWPWQGHQVHLDCFRAPHAPAKLILFHGVGTNGRQMSTILGAPLSRLGIETIAVDMPEYGETKVGRGAAVTYGDWVRLGSDLVDAELARDDRPIVLYGLSAGGMLAYDVAALNRKVDGIVGMTFLDQRIQQVRDETALNKMMSRVGVPMARLTARTPLGRLRMPMSLASKMHALVNDQAALKACLADRTSAGKWVTMAFLASYMSYESRLDPEQFDVCPILLTQPAQDAWTPLHLSELFLERIQGAPVQVVSLQGAGHLPIEARGLAQMRDAILAFVLDCSGQDAVDGARAATARHPRTWPRRNGLTHPTRSAIGAVERSG